MDNPTNKLTIDFNKRKFDATVRYVLFMEGEHHLAYVPALKISGYGDTYDEAVEMIKVAAKQYLITILDTGKKDGEKELKSIGWIKDTLFNKQYDNNVIDNESIIEMYDLPRDTKMVADQLMVM